jgi:hypothetical protein
LWFRWVPVKQPRQGTSLYLDEMHLNLVHWLAPWPLGAVHRPSSSSVSTLEEPTSPEEEAWTAPGDAGPWEPCMALLVFLWGALKPVVLGFCGHTSVLCGLEGIFKSSGWILFYSSQSSVFSGYTFKEILKPSHCRPKSSLLCVELNLVFKLYFYPLFIFVMLGMKPRALCTLGMHTTELHSSS